MHFDRPDRLFEFSFCLVQFIDNPSFQIAQRSDTCMAAILKALSIVINENRRNKVFTMIKQLNFLLIKLIYSCDLHFNVSSVLHSERC